MRRCLIVAAALATACLNLFGQSPDPPASPVRVRVAAARKQVEANPKSAQAFNDLAFALCRSARDAEDVTLYQKAQDAVQRSLDLAPGNYAARKLQAAVLLGEHNFQQAQQLAIELNNSVRDDIAGWALLVDVNVAVGNYADAERAAQWILDLRPGSSLGFLKAAGLREVFGDAEGAAEFYQEAIKRTAQSDPDERAWLLIQDARLQVAMAKPERAEELLRQAVQLFPNSQLALAGLAAVRNWQGRYAEAAELLGQKYRALDSVGNLYDWADALAKAGQKREADAAFEDFERRANEVSNKPYNWNQKLVYFYAARKRDSTKALRIAKQEIALRHDVSTLDAYAWALYASADYSEARNQLDVALKVGVRDPIYFCHAAQIAAKLNDRASEQRFAKEVSTFGASSCPIEGQATVVSQVLP